MQKRMACARLALLRASLAAAGCAHPVFQRPDERRRLRPHRRPSSGGRAGEAASARAGAGARPADRRLLYDILLGEIAGPARRAGCSGCRLSEAARTERRPAHRRTRAENQPCSANSRIWRCRRPGAGWSWLRTISRPVTRWRRWRCARAMRRKALEQFEYLLAPRGRCQRSLSVDAGACWRASPTTARSGVMERAGRSAPETTRTSVCLRAPGGA